MCRGGTELSFLHNWIRKGAMQPRHRRDEKQERVVEAFAEVLHTMDPQAILSALDAVEKLAGKAFYRWDLWRSMHRTLRDHDPTKGISLPDTAWHVRDQGRHHGHKLPRRSIATPLLVKGLEFDHVVILDVARLTTEQLLYVALTRGSRSVTVFSREAIVQHPSCRVRQPSSAADDDRQLTLFSM